MASSPVGTSAKQLARQGRSLETKASRFFVKRIATFFSRLIPKPLQNLLHAVGKTVWRAMSVVVVFIGRWFKTRKYWHLIGGAPAFLLALPLAYCMIRMPFYGSDAKAKHYRAAAADALENKQYGTAELYYRKLYQLDAMNERAEYQSAYNAFESGSVLEGIAKFKELAPDDQAGFAPAHLWLAQWYLHGKSELPKDESYQLAEKHLRFALDHDPGNPQARALRALHFERTGRLDEALNELRQVVKILPQKGLTLARLYARQGRWQDARQEITKVLEIYQEKQQRGDDLGPVEYLIWSEAYLILGEHEKAESVLEEGLSRQPSDSRIRDRLYEQYITRAGFLGDQRSSVVDQVLLLKRSWELKPDEYDPLVMISHLAMAPGEKGETALATVRQILASDTPPTMLNTIIGTSAASKGRYEEAVGYLRNAYEANDDDPQTLNNLAWVLLKLKSELTEALQLANRAVQLKPDLSMYRETRGQLFVLLGRYAEAVDDLELALNGLGDDDAIHAALAVAYEQLGETELAGQHRQQTQ